MMASLGSFLSENVGALLAAAVTGTIAWFATHAIAKPILEIREVRLKALQLAERNAHVRSTAPEGRIKAAQSAIADVAAELLALARARHGIAGLYCKSRRYDLELAVRCLNGLMRMIGDDSYRDENVSNNLDTLYYCLRAHRHLSRTRRTEIKGMLRAAAPLRLAEDSSVRADSAA